MHTLGWTFHAVTDRFNCLQHAHAESQGSEAEASTLRQLITIKEPMREEVKRRIIKGRRSYWSLKEPMKDKKLHINIKRKLFNMHLTHPYVWLPIMDTDQGNNKQTCNLSVRNGKEYVECEEIRQIEKLCHKIYNKNYRLNTENQKT
ncbi:hypothetical protein EVAR_12746_1 [Eumeta japonica]|uniref:Uncharacterized protein n=1 Tax=Eumeta variegata TaxID=151549 RepID=A0A4C1UN03_EUMVA|nr:hypothetical protein EVAR_12746_1 [Eumeta japonica]